MENRRVASHWPLDGHATYSSTRSTQGSDKNAHIEAVARKVIAQYLADDGTFPNSRLPLLIYKSALKLNDDHAASQIESMLEANGWTGSWRNGVYAYHHYHRTAHEVLVCYAGEATVQFGGEAGISASLRPGDAVIIPAGVAHKNLDATPDFAVVGAYPAGQKYDMNYGKQGERPQADEKIARVALPRTDPLYGKDGPVLDHWRMRLRH